MHRRYLIIPITLTGSIDYTEVDNIETKVSTDGTETYVRYESGSRPSFYSSSYTELDINNAYTLFKSNEWGLAPDIEILRTDL